MKDFPYFPNFATSSRPSRQRQMRKYRLYGLLDRKNELTPKGREAYAHFRSFMDRYAGKYHRELFNAQDRVR